MSVQSHAVPDPPPAGPDPAAEAALRELPDALAVVFDEQLRFVSAAGRVLDRRGDRPLCPEGELVADAFVGDTWGSIEPLLHSALEGETRSREIWSDAQRYCLMVDAGPRVPADPQPGPDRHTGAADGPGGVAMVLDITARRRADAFARPATDRIDGVREQTPIAAGLLDAEGCWALANRALSEMTGYTTRELLGARLEEMLEPEDAQQPDTHGRLLSGEIAVRQERRRLLDAAGEAMSVIVSMSLVRDRDGAPLYFPAQLQDVSERRRLEEDVRHLADHDPLTGLRNGRLFEHDVRLQVARARRYEELAAVMVVDLDGLRTLNERHGPTAGDEILRAVARALGRRVRETDIVARLGGDRFGVLLAHVGREGAATVAEDLDRVVGACGIETAEAVLHPRASIGFALVDRHTESAEQALAQADSAMQVVKRGRPPRA